jgi:hypothetical protein
MHLQKRIKDLVLLGQGLQKNEEDWQAITATAFYNNGWFTQEFIQIAVKGIVENFLQEEILMNFCKKYDISENHIPKKVGIVCAGNIPLVGFHDLMCVILCGHHAVLKLSSKDTILMKAVVEKLYAIDVEYKNLITISEMLKNCDAYITTGSNNSSRYFEFYFNKYPSIIRKNKTSVAVLTGKETTADLEKLADDVMLYFGLGCRNVTKIYVPKDYNFENLIQAFDSYKYLADHNKLKNNYDYNLALYLLNNQYYMTNGAVLLVENEAIFSPLSCLHYSFYTDISTVYNTLKNNEDIQTIIGLEGTPLGQAQQPKIENFADGIDTMSFLSPL